MKSLILLFLILGLTMTSCEEKKQPITDLAYLLFVGAYTQGNEGIAVYRFNAKTGDLQYLLTNENVQNPSYLAIHEDKNLLIAVNEVGEFQGKPSGAVSSFSFDPKSGALELLGQVASGGGAPCYLAMDNKAKFALVANYSGGNVGMLPIGNEGNIEDLADLIQHEGSSIDERRQKGPYAHTIVFDPDERYALAADLGIDQVITYEINREESRLIQVGIFETAPGAGPRHLAFHPNGKFVYIINELNSTMTSCSYDSETGQLREVMTVSTLPDGFEGTNSCADVHVSPDGRFVYGSNRGHESIAIFKTDASIGNIENVGYQNVKGKTPRNFTIEPTGKFLLVANQNSNNIVVFSIDEETGLLTDTGVEVQTPKPVCLKMVLQNS